MFGPVAMENFIAEPSQEVFVVLMQPLVLPQLLG